MAIKKGDFIKASDWNSRSLSYSTIYDRSVKDAIGDDSITESVYFWIRGVSVLDADDMDIHVFDGTAQPLETKILYKGAKFKTLDASNTDPPSEKLVSDDANYEAIAYTNLKITRTSPPGMEVGFKVYPWNGSDWATEVIDRAPAYGDNKHSYEYSLYPGYYKLEVTFDDTIPYALTPDAKLVAKIKQGSTTALVGSLIRSFNTDYSDLAPVGTYGEVKASDAPSRNLLCQAEIEEIGGTQGSYTGVY